MELLSAGRKGVFMNRLGSLHLTRNDRVKIQEDLGKGLSLKDVATDVAKDERTVSKEVRKRRNKKDNGRSAFREHPEECKKLRRFPFVCNGCAHKNCTYKTKCYYDALLAQDNYEIALSSTRTGIDMTLEDKISLDSILKNGVDKGQSIHHIVATHPQEIKCSERTVYRLVDKNKTVIQNVDLRRKVKMKPRKSHVAKIDPLEIRNGRSYLDFIDYYASSAAGLGIVEMDTVEGPQDGLQKCLLTLHFTALHFMLAILLDRKSKECVSAAFSGLLALLGPADYARLFPLILTDRGCEFCDPLAIENDPSTGESLSRIFFCNSYSSYQKGAIEENHTLVRYVIPKGTSMNGYDQSQIDTMLSHVNSYVRKSVSACPFELFRAFYGDELLNKLKVRQITPDLVTLKPTLLK